MPKKVTYSSIPTSEIIPKKISILPTGALSVIVGETDTLDNLWMQLWCKVFYRKIYFYILAR